MSHNSIKPGRRTFSLAFLFILTTVVACYLAMPSVFHLAGGLVGVALTVLAFFGAVMGFQYGIFWVLGAKPGSLGRPKEPQDDSSGIRHVDD